jgi:hypothetical protein
LLLDGVRTSDHRFGEFITMYIYRMIPARTWYYQSLKMQVKIATKINMAKASDKTNGKFSIYNII